MKIQYADLDEFLTVLEKCKEISKKGNCGNCALFEICDFGSLKMLPAIMEGIDE